MDRRLMNGGFLPVAPVVFHDWSKLEQLADTGVGKPAGTVLKKQKTAEKRLLQFNLITGADWSKLEQAKAVAPVVYISPYYIGGIYNHNWSSLLTVAWTGASHGRS